MHTVKMSTHSLGWKQFVKSLLTITLGPFNERHTRFFFYGRRCAVPPTHPLDHSGSYFFVVHIFL